MLGQPIKRYDPVAMILHWVMALGIVALAVMGLYMVHGKPDPARLFQLYQLHKSIGITVLLTAVIRLGWRLWRRPPLLSPGAQSPLERRAANGVHWTLYGFLLLLPLTGWALVSVSVFDIPTVLYGVVPWPHLPILSALENKEPAEAVFKLIHAYGAWALIALVAVHAAAAIRHGLRRDGIMGRMLPPVRHRPIDF